MNGSFSRIARWSLLLALGNTWVLPALADETTATPPAEPPNVTRAKERKLEGDKAMDSLRHADALAAYTEAYSLDPQPALLYNLGRTYEALDQLPEALEKLQAFQSSAPPELLAKVPGLKDRIANLQKRLSQLKIKVNIAGARILVRDKVVGKSPLELVLLLKAGPASVIIEADGYFPYQADVNLPGGGMYVVDAQLSSKEKTGRLIVQAPKTNVSVSLDGRSLGQAPLETITAAGTHKILARHPAHSDYETTVIVKAGEDRTVMVTLGDPPVYKRWWFWTAVGVVVAGGTATTIALVTEQPPTSGDIPPYKLRSSFYVVTPVFQF